ncbi:MAG TPA: endonuclease/exonuclease/phosphatase family protein [Solirubrobacterales bacterium]
MTWNLQGSSAGFKWRMVEQAFTRAKIDVALLQEVGVPPGALEKVSAERWMGSYGKRRCSTGKWRLGSAGRPGVPGRGLDTYFAFYNWDALGARRNNLAVVSRTEFTKVFTRRNPVSPRGRPMLGVEVNGALLATIHAMASSRRGGSKGNDGPGYLRTIAGMGFSRWCCAGDWNRIPTKLEEDLPENTFLLDPDQPTYRSTHQVIDYAVSTERGSARVPQGAASDHQPVYLTIPTL